VYGFLSRRLKPSVSISAAEAAPDGVWISISAAKAFGFYLGG
jgi:hypothetical protein